MQLNKETKPNRIVAIFVSNLLILRFMSMYNTIIM